MCCCFPLILFFPFENLIVDSASDNSLYLLFFLYSAAKIRKISENEQDK